MTDGESPPQNTVQGADRLRHAITLFLFGVFVGLVVLRAGNLWVRHEEILAENQRRIESLAHVLSEHLAQKVATIDAALWQISLHSERVGGPNAKPSLWEPVLQAAFAGLSNAGSISIVNELGVVSQSTIPAVTGQERRDTNLFRHLEQTPTTVLIADTPFQSAFGRGMILPFGRRLIGADGEFRGVAMATLEPEQLRHFYRSIELEEGSEIALLHPRAGVVLHEPPIAGATAHDHKVPLASDAAVGETFLLAPLKHDGQVMLSAYRSVPSAKLTLSVSVEEARVLAAWRREVRNSLGFAGGLACLLLFAGYFINREIRARAAADLALSTHQARFHEIMYNVPIFVSVKDVEGRIQFMSRALEELFGKTLQEAKHKRLRDVASAGAGPAALIEALDREVVETRAPIQRELTYPTTEGTRTALFIKFPLFSPNGEVEAVASFSTDLTEQRRAANWFRTIMDHAPPLIALKDRDGKLLFVNRAQEQASGIKASEFLGRKSADLFPPEYAALHDAYDQEVIAARAPVQRQFTAPYNTGERSLLFVKFPIFDAKGAIESIGSIATDVTAQKHAEAQLATAQRMEAVGQLTGGIAHDFNNLLTVIIGNSELLTEELARNERLRPLAQVTLDAAERSAALTQRLLAFGRRQLLEPRSTDVRALVEEMQDLIKRAAGPGVELKLRCADDEPWPAIVDPGQLETAILNLVVNSRDAMPDGGRIVIETANVELDEDYAELNPDAKPGEYVMIAVSDTGTGMPSEVVARVFEPFFTTKEVGKGTGLGLPTIYGFIRQSGGHVKIYSEIGHGTAARLYIPRATSASLVPALPAVRDCLPRGHERVLLVEDDRIVRTFTEGQLSEFGYQVTTASDPEEALKIALVSGQPDLLITDLVMPGKMNGRDLARRMRERWPGLGVVCVSGYTDGLLPEVINGRADGFYFLSKPFRRRDLALKVREALDARPVTAASVIETA